MIIFRVLGYVSHSANFEITEIDDSSKCLGGGYAVTLKYVRSGRGDTLETFQSVKGGGG